MTAASTYTPPPETMPETKPYSVQPPGGGGGFVAPPSYEASTTYPATPLPYSVNPTGKVYNIISSHSVLSCILIHPIEDF